MNNRKIKLKFLVQGYLLLLSCLTSWFNAICSCCLALFLGSTLFALAVLPRFLVQRCLLLLSYFASWINIVCSCSLAILLGSTLLLLATLPCFLLIYLMLLPKMLLALKITYLTSRKKAWENKKNPGLSII